MSSGESAHIQYYICFKILLRIRHPVPQHKSALRVGVIDLYTLPAIQNVDIIRDCCCRSYRVLGYTQNSVEILGETALNLGQVAR